MALQSPAFVISADSHSAALFRQTLQTLISGAGVSESTGLAVSQNSTPNMSVNVAAGMIWMPGTLGATSGFGNNISAQTAYTLPSGKTAQGMYCGYNDATVNLAISAADPTNPRIDLIVAAVQDAQYAGSTNTPVLQVITGTPAPSPSAPSAPASSVVLAQVAVAAGVTSIVTANITDKRPILAVNGGIVRATGTTQYPANPVTGDYVDDANLGLQRWTGTGWDPIPAGTSGVQLVKFLSASAQGSPNSGTAGWPNLPNVTVPKWAKSAVVDFSYTSVTGPGSGVSLNVNVQGVLAGVSGTSFRLPFSSLAGGYGFAWSDYFTGLASVAGTSQALAINATFVAGSGNYQISANNPVIAKVTFLPV